MKVEKRRNNLNIAATGHDHKEEIPMRTLSLARRKWGTALLSSMHQAWVSCPITGPLPPDQTTSRVSKVASTPGLLTRSWSGESYGFPLDDSRGFAHTDHVQVTGRKPAHPDHPHHDIVRVGRPLVRHHHPT